MLQPGRSRPWGHHIIEATAVAVGGSVAHTGGTVLWGAATPQWRAEEAANDGFGHFQVHAGVGEQAERVLAPACYVRQALDNARSGLSSLEEAFIDGAEEVLTL